jgi:Mn2+/Fe2+ NRAMP family transporter
MWNRVMQQLGPGLITGAADDDPSGNATYTQAGAQYACGLLWTLVLTPPLMTAIQLVSARIGWFTRRGVAANLRTISRDRSSTSSSDCWESPIRSTSGPTSA